VVFAGITALAILTVARPLMRATNMGAVAAPEMDAYRLQLAELSREEERGIIGKDEAGQTRNEISRRLLKASRQSTAKLLPGGTLGVSANTAFVILAAAIALGAAGLYAIFGAPGLVDQPLEARLNAPPELQSLAIQIANVEHRLRAHPEDTLGWTVIAPVYFKTGQFGKAADAYRRAIKLDGENEDKLLGLFESLTFAGDGVVPASAKPALDSALARNPKSLRGRFWLAIAAIQEGRKADAEQIYRQMLNEDISPAWKGVIAKQLEGLAAKPAETAAGDLGQGEQGAMIRGMVERLAARLKDNPDDFDGWLKLMRSYAVLKETGKAQEAHAAALAQFASEPQALEKIEALARGLGLNPAAAEAGQSK
jgi:cytochrome c-type biogenesis protein CcmH